MGRGEGIDFHIGGRSLHPLPRPCGGHRSQQVTLCGRRHPSCRRCIGGNAVVARVRRRGMVSVSMVGGNQDRRRLAWVIIVGGGE